MITQKEIKEDSQVSYVSISLASYLNYRVLVDVNILLYLAMYHIFHEIV